MLSESLKLALAKQILKLFCVLCTFYVPNVVRIGVTQRNNNMVEKLSCSTRKAPMRL